MSVALAKDSIDLGIVVRDGDAALRFYRDTLGLPLSASTPLGGGSVMHRLMCGTTMVKLVVPAEVPAAANPPGGIPTASGLRYWTISVSNLDQVLADAESAGYKVAWKAREIRPGVRVGMVEDPDGNWVELLEAAS
jgi:catechol 2,3-dioxygenase-like lactoylglutathione lyase family enzyme